MTTLRLVSEHKCFEGRQAFYAHDSRECATEMKFSVYVPPQAKAGRVPVLYYLMRRGDAPASMGQVEGKDPNRAVQPTPGAGLVGRGEATGIGAGLAPAAAEAIP